MREHVLDAEPSPDLRVYAVWLHQRITDKRGAIDESILADPRVTQYWDAEGITGTFFADTDLGGLGASGFVYDVYYVFAGDARWGDVYPHRSPARARPLSTSGDELLADSPGAPVATGAPHSSAGTILGESSPARRQAWRPSPPNRRRRGGSRSRRPEAGRADVADGGALARELAGGRTRTPAGGGDVERQGPRQIGLDEKARHSTPLFEIRPLCGRRG